MFVLERDDSIATLCDGKVELVFFLEDDIPRTARCSLCASQQEELPTFLGGCLRVSKTVCIGRALNVFPQGTGS
jgi:hypothetical protein